MISPAAICPVAFRDTTVLGCAVNAVARPRPPSNDTFKLGTTVVLDTTRGAVPVVVVLM